MAQNHHSSFPRYTPANTSIPLLRYYYTISAYKEQHSTPTFRVPGSNCQNCSQYRPKRKISTNLSKCRKPRKHRTISSAHCVTHVALLPFAGYQTPTFAFAIVAASDSAAESGAANHQTQFAMTSLQLDKAAQHHGHNHHLHLLHNLQLHHPSTMTTTESLHLIRSLYAALKSQFRSNHLKWPTPKPLMI